MHRDTKAKKITIQPSNNKSRTINIKKNAQIVEWITNKNQLNKKIITKIKIAANTKVDYIFLLDKKFNSDFIEKLRSC